MLDPPWPKRKGNVRKVRPNQGRALDYPTMPVPDIFALLDASIFPLAAPAHVVFLWTIDEFLTEADTYMEQRRYRRHARIVWDKGNGPAPAFTLRYSHEYMVWYYRSPMPKIASDKRGVYRSVLQAPGRQHSRKPDEAYVMVEALYPNTKRIDVFSREKRAGWDQWGNQTDYFTEVA